MGGIDPDNQTLKVMRSLRRPEFFNINVKVIVGAKNTHVDALESEAASADVPRIDLLRNPSDIPRLMEWADLAISAAGSTCWELCFMGVPSVLITLAKNQESLSSGLHEKQAARHLGLFPDVDENSLASAVGELLDDREERKRLSCSARALVDGRGAARVCYALLGEPESTWDREIFVSRQ
jgi:spore coat polysaccharide biosynthesis predicted glycosyltransferase SpsG